jgi:hypothetical protein
VKSTFNANELTITNNELNDEIPMVIAHLSEFNMSNSTFEGLSSYF